MGKLAKPQRSKKHKKIKAVDPFYHGARKDARQEGWNQKPKITDQEVPKKLKRLGFSIEGVKSGKVGKKSRNKFKKHPDAPQKYNSLYSTPLGLKPGTKLKTPESQKKDKVTSDASDTKPKHKKFKKGSAPEISETDLNEYIDALKPTRQFVEPFQFKRKSSETEAAFMRRVNKTTDRVLAKSKIDDKFDVSDEKKILSKLKAKKGMSEKKKQRLKEKKQKKEAGVKEKRQEKLLDFNALTDKVEFGDVVHAPPVLSVRPRKAVVTDVDRPGKRMPELKDALACNSLESANSSQPEKIAKLMKNKKERQAGKSVKRKSLTVIEKRIADAQRENFIDTYRQLKKSKQ